MRVLHLLASHRWTGAAEPAVQLAQTQAASDFTVRIAFAGGGGIEREVADRGLDGTTAIPFDRGLNPLRRIGDLQALRGIIAEFKPDVLHCHLTHDHLLALWARRGERPPIVRTFHRAPSANFLLPLLLHQTDGNVAVSEGIRGAIRAAAPRAAVQQISGAVDTELFQPSGRGGTVRAARGIPADALLFGFVGRIREERGVFTALDAAAVLAHEPKAWLAIIGKGHGEEELEKRLEGHPLQQRIVTFGTMPPEEFRDTMDALDAAIVLKPGNDGSCRAAMQAMAMCKPVIGSREGALKDWIREGETGWLSEPGEVDSLARCLLEATREDLGAMGRAARMRITTEGSVRLQMERYRDLYDRAMAG